ncbi:Protein of unknown function [Cotesia congregata]|uniref:Uncharacterized protein n=1 Tax=Cotesia congregata TaxID=51543 RepID=A0A8J2H7V9_COTCN|nr:Protein of unknown function [Cotesia congregata]
MWAVIRDPEAPKGCPRAIAPPLTFNLLISRPKSLTQARVCAPKASLISTSSRSLRVFLDSFKRCLIAGAGPIPMILGSTPTVVYPYKRARVCGRGCSSTDTSICFFFMVIETGAISALK